MMTLLFALFLISPVIAQINCPGGLFTPAARARGLDFHNVLRASIAQGRSRPGPTSGSNINLLRYDCGLETISQNHAILCPSSTSAPRTRPGIGQNMFQIRLPASRVPLVNAINYAATQWWNQVINRGWRAGADNVYTAAVAATGIESYAQMAWGTTTLVGCGIANCPGFRPVVCSYMTNGPIIGQAMVQPGPGCTSNADCTTFPGATCDFALRSCSVPAGTNPVPSSSTASPSTTASSAACSGSPLFTAADRTLIVNNHNTLRSNIAKGMTINMVVTRGCQNMFTMTYDCALEDAAQQQADACDMVGMPAQRGRNIFVNNANAAPTAALTAAITAWQAELATPAFTVNAILSSVAGQPNQVSLVGQFATMAYNRAWSVGCGYARCNATAVQVVCRYRMARGDTSKVYNAVTTNVGCTQNRCAAINNTATCNTTTGLCQFP